MAKLTDELEQSLIHLQEVQGNKETEIVRLRMELEERTRERSEAESQLEKTQHNLQSLTEERDRLREIEEVWLFYYVLFLFFFFFWNIVLKSCV